MITYDDMKLLGNCNPLWVQELPRNAHTLEYEVSSRTHKLDERPERGKMLCNHICMHAYALEYARTYAHTHARETAKV